jgi:thiol-disulfide isomerase/thioredoxin
MATPAPAPAPATPAPAATPPANPSPAAGVLVGDVTREQIEQAAPEWVQAEVESAPDAATATSLASVEPGADVTVFLGTWCGDSRREVPRLWRALDQNAGSLPFALHYIAVDHNKKEPKGRTGPERIGYVPTFIVRRGGQEVGRIVEQSPNGIEHDLLDLLTGHAHGVVSSRTDIQDAGRPNG